MTNLTTTTLNSVSDIDDSCWQSVNKDNNTYFSSGFLRAFETSNPNIDQKSGLTVQTFWDTNPAGFIQ